MFGRRRLDIKKEFDDFLLDSINQAKSEWQHAQETEAAISEVDDEIVAQTQLERQKYLYLYREARLRNVHNNRIQSSVIDY